MSEQVRVLVCGGRDWEDEAAVCGELEEFREELGMFGDRMLIVHGYCPTGADHFSKAYAVRNGLDQEPHPADWDAHGKASGPIRNREMAKAGAEVCFAFWDGKSKGTLDMIKQATAHGIPVRIVPKGVR